MTHQFEQLLKDVGFKLAALREARNRFSDQLAPEFRIFDYLRTDEMGLSTCIAALLDPNGKHGQGSIFLDAFLKNIGVDGLTNTKNCQVSTEKQANGQRRLDIFLEFPDGIMIGIENKPWASCQDKQLADYADYLEKIARGREWKLVFLSNRDPEEKSLARARREKLESDGWFVRQSYGDIIDWLDYCSSKTRALVVRVFIEELAKFIRTKINGEIEMSDEKEVSKAVLKSSETVGSAIQIVKAWNGIKKELLNTFRHDLLHELNKEGLILENWGLDKWNATTGFDIQIDRYGQNFYLRFEFYQSDLNGFLWGVFRKNAKYHDPVVWNAVYEVLAAEFYPGKSNEWYPWYSEALNRAFDEDIKNWSTNEIPWVWINENKMASKIVNLAVRVRESFIRNNQLHLLG